MIAVSDVVYWGRRQLIRAGRISPGSRKARRFASFGKNSAIAFPATVIFGEAHIRIGSQVLIGPRLTLTAGLSPGHRLESDSVISIGDRCLIGEGSGIVAVSSISIGDDVFTGHNVYITDCNHGYEDVTIPPGLQIGQPRPVSIGQGAWLGHGSIVLPGARIGRNSVIGAGSVVTGTIPDFAVAVGNPARVIRRFDGQKWVMSGTGARGDGITELLGMANRVSTQVL